MKTEHTIQNEIRVALTENGYTVFRANVGKVKTVDGRWFDTGLPKGHPDLYGFRPDGKIFYIEVKNAKGQVRPEQKSFIKTVKARGALAGIARSVEDALDIIHGVYVDETNVQGATTARTGTSTVTTAGAGTTGTEKNEATETVKQPTAETTNAETGSKSNNTNQSGVATNDDDV